MDPKQKESFWVSLLFTFISHEENVYWVMVVKRRNQTNIKI